MGFFSILKLLFLPALIAAGIYALLAYLIIPIYRNHHARYSQYLPLDALSERTSGIRERIKGTLTRWLLPSHMRWRHEVRHDYGGDAGSGDELFFGDEEGESMVGFDVGRRERLIRVADVSGGDGERRAEMDSERRLSRDLEEGFKDESEDDEGDDRRR